MTNVTTPAEHRDRDDHDASRLEQAHRQGRAEALGQRHHGEPDAGGDGSGEGDAAAVGHGIGVQRMARAMTTRWISLVPS